MAGLLSDIKKGLSDALANVPGLRVAEQIPEQINPPVAVISRSAVDYTQAMSGGLTEWTMQVELIAGRMAEQHSQRVIDGWLSWDGQTSVRKAIEADRTLGGNAETCIVTGAQTLHSLSVGDAEYLGVTMNVTIYA